jgi:hypothetical protein
MMFRAVIITAWLGFALLLGATIALGIFNWNKFYTPLGALGLALAGTFAGLCTLGVILKEDVFGGVFTTFVVINAENYLPMWPNDITPANMELARNHSSLVSRLFEYSGLAIPTIHDSTGKEVTLFEGPHNESDTTAFYEQLLQYKVVMEIVDMHNPNPRLTVTLGSGTSIGRVKVFSLSELQTKPLLEICPDISKAKFANNPVRRAMLEADVSRLPKDTKVTLPGITSANPNEKHAVALTKPLFFTIEIVIEPAEFPAQPGLPAGSGITPEMAAKSKTLMFKIAMQARFEKITSGNYRTAELKDWAKWVFERLESRLSDTTAE